MRSIGIVLGAWLLVAGLGLTGWAAPIPPTDNARFQALLALDGSKSMQGFQAAGSLGRVAEAFQASSRAAGLDHQIQVFSSRSPAGAPEWRVYRAEMESGQFEGAYTRLPEAFDNSPQGTHFVFFLTDNLDNQGAAGRRLVERFRGDDVAAVLAVPMSLAFQGQVFENDLGACLPASLVRLLDLHQTIGPLGRRAFAYRGPRGLIGYLVVRNPWDPRQRQVLVGPATDLLRELAKQTVFHRGETGQFPMLPLKCFPDGLRGEMEKLHPANPSPVDLSAGGWVELQPLRLVLPELLPGVAVRANAPAGGPGQVVGLLGPPQARMEEPEPEHAPWLQGERATDCYLLKPTDENHPDTLRLSVRLAPLGRDPVGLLDWGRFLHLAGGATSRLTLTLELHPYLHASVLETAPVIREALLTGNPCELTKVAFPSGADPILMLAPEDDKRLKLHLTRRVALEGRHPFWAPDTARFLLVWSLAALLALLVGGLFWLRLHSRQFKYMVLDSSREPAWGRNGKRLRLQPTRLSEPLKDQRGQEIGRLRLPWLGWGLEFRPADQVRLAGGRPGPERIPKSRCLELWLPLGGATTETFTGQDHARRKVYLWVKKL